MKKLIALIAAVLIGMPALAKSNCQTRVDKNLDKTTSEKIQKCLTEDPVEEDKTPQPEVVLTDTYSVIYPQSKSDPKQKQNPKQGQKQSQKQNNTKQTTEQKTYKPEPVQHEYLDGTTYPSFRNDELPTLNQEEAHDTAMQALKGYNKPAVTRPAKQNKPAVKPATKTPPQEIQEADALQDDPLATAQSTQLTEFQDDSVLSPADFGYNDTDPAFQQ